MFMEDNKMQTKPKVFAAAILIAVFFFIVPILSRGDAMVPVSDKSVEEQLVDTMTQLAHGPYKDFRANHAKGIMASGTFMPSAEAPGLSKAAHLQISGVPVRFSDTTGVPGIPDADPNASPRG